MSVIAAFSISPMGGPLVGEDGSVGEAVAEVVRIVRASGLPNETNAMFTNVEGSLEEVLSLVRRCTEYVATVAPRVSVVVKLDVRPSVTDALHAKVATVERHLGNPGIPARELRNDVSGELHRVEHGDIEAVRAGERLVLTVHGEAIADIVTHAGRSRWIPGDLMRRGLAERTADTALPDDLDELAGQTLDQL